MSEGIECIPCGSFTDSPTCHRRAFPPYSLETVLYLNLRITYDSLNLRKLAETLAIGATDDGDVTYTGNEDSFYDDEPLTQLQEVEIVNSKNYDRTEMEIV